MSNSFKNLAYLAVLLIVAGGSFYFGKSTAAQAKNIQASSSPTPKATQPVLPPPQATTTINKNFQFPIVNDSGQTVGQFSYSLTTG